MNAKEVQAKFGLLIEEFGAWETVIRQAKLTWRQLIISQRNAIKGEWLAIFEDDLTEWPNLVCRSSDDYCPKPGPGSHSVPMKITAYSVRVQSASLVEISLVKRLETASHDRSSNKAVHEMIGCVRRVHVIEVKRGPEVKSVLLYYGRVHQLEWDPARFKWPQRVPFMSYIANVGRKILLKTHPVPNVVEKKWFGVLPISYNFLWLNVWDSERVKKEAGLLWAVWHKGVEVNA